MGNVTGEFLAKVKLDIDGDGIPDKVDGVVDILTDNGTHQQFFEFVEQNIKTELDDVVDVDIYNLKLEDNYGDITSIINNRNKDGLIDTINSLILDYKSIGGSAKDISDKYHTFGELYYHRMILFLVIQKSFPELSWKSKKHDDNTMFEDSFIVGINTPKGQYTYHYNLKFWDMFDGIKELEFAPKFDGHTPSDIDDRLLSLF